MQSRDEGAMRSKWQRWRMAGLAAGMGMGLAAPALAQTPPTLFQNWLTDLSKHGFGVTQGSAVVSSVAYCNDVVVPVFGTCFLQDPNDPYIATLMPSSGEYVDPYFGQMDNQTLPNGLAGGSVFTLGTNEAEVTILTLPPEAAYFSYQGYVFTRPTSYYKRVSQVSPDPARADMFASYSNSVNSVDILKQAGLSWGQGTVAIISTANAALANALSKQFTAVGGSASLVFIDPIGLNVHPGTDQSADDFISLMRYLVPANQTNSDNWLNNITNNVFVYRVDAPSGSGSLLYGTQTLLTKSYNFNETVYSSDMTELATLMEGWLKTQETKPSYKIKQSGETEKVSQSGVVLSGDVGFACLKSGTNCNSDQQDGAHWNASVGKLPSGRLFVVAGVDHNVTDNSTLLSLAIEDGTTSTGVLGFSETNPNAAGFSVGAIAGSAQEALQDLGLWSQASPQLKADAPNLFVQIFTRGCTASQTYCNYPFTTLIPTSAVPYKDAVTATARGYVLPGMPNSANPDYMLPLTVIF